MSKSFVNTNPYPFTFTTGHPITTSSSTTTDPSTPSTKTTSTLSGPITLTLPNTRGTIPSIPATRLRSLIHEASSSPDKILALVCSYDGLSSKLCVEAGFPALFLNGYAMAASMGMPDTGYIAFQEVVQRLQEVVRVVKDVPIIVDGDTGYGAAMNVRRCVEGFARAGAAGVMIEDQTWPKRCGHTQGKSVVSLPEALARWRAAVDARNNGLDIWILARTDALIHGYDEALTRARAAIALGVDCIFVEALPDRETMHRLVRDLDGFPLMANIIEGGRTEMLSAADLGGMGYALVTYPWTLVAARLRSVREALEGIKGRFLEGKPEVILGYGEVCEGVGFTEYYEMEERYLFEGAVNGSKGFRFKE
ncbi:Pyruvate/Phosphoenolpyruvate kinase-like domain-containing protein [Aspergillus keveii]|uniref:Pyruvate/Phosphoenolpyruvate kinase-like domain-containing protein n=1 Tax=Aspergillus keveii TaxID=714993 RepID=A0ABR4FM13_9EURO